MSETLEHYDDTMRWLLSRAGELLGAEARPVELAWDVQRLFRRQTRRISRHGLREGPPTIAFADGRTGHALSVGMEVQTLAAPDDGFRFVQVTTPDPNIADFYAVAARDVRRFYRYVRKLARRTGKQVPPLLPPETNDALWANTIGWLTRDRSRLAQYGLPLRRGVLLLGAPGNGKTMACRWLRYECLRRGLEWTNVSRQQYETAVCNGSVRELFELDHPGVVLFDDLDAGLKDRTKFDDQGQSTFLTELDGMYPKSGVIFMFTSNLELQDIDPSARRPGRIDTVLRFEPPTAALRRRLVVERWPSELVGELAIETVVSDTEGLSFAELEEARKMLVLHYLDHHEVSWAAVQKDLVTKRQAVQQRRVIGFSRERVAEEEGVVSARTAS